MDPAQTDLMNCMIGAAPEREAEIRQIWRDYAPKVIVEDLGGMTLNANRERISIDVKMFDVFWLIGFSGWRAIETYIPSVITSALTDQPIATVLQQDTGLPNEERAYKERIAAVHAFIRSSDARVVAWPPDIPQPTPSREGLFDEQHKATFDLTLSAVAFTLFHEFRHVMLDRDGERPCERTEEELACDVWAREFVTVKAAEYAASKGLCYAVVLQRRSMAFALAALILHEITPIWEHGGNGDYFSIATRMETILKNTPLADESHFWNFSAALLIGMCRQKHIPFDPPAMSARALTDCLVAKI
jgi:hypothetical protein